MAGVAPGARLPLAVSVMLASTMNALDMTIANVALPHMQGGVSASREQIAWVLTSFIVASALTIPLTGWMTGRIGRKRLVLIAIAGFTAASIACGLATTLPEMVLFRFLQGMFGAPLTPLSQAVMLDAFPPNKHGQAMAVWGMGTVLGPVAGPLIGGVLTDQLSWRWVFFINAPIGVMAFIGCWLFMSGSGQDERRPFDFLGFAGIAGFIGSLQLMIDRGPSVDWFNATETWTYLIIALISLWVFVIHSLTAQNPFFDRRLMADRNFTTATVFGFMTGMMLLSSVSILPPMLQGLMGYSAYQSGVLTVPRGVGALASMFVIGRLVGRSDPRVFLAGGMALTALAAWQMTHLDLVLDEGLLKIAGLFQGFGLGMMFVPTNTLAFATVPLALRPEASAINTIVRTMGGSVGISIMQGLAVANTQVIHESLAAKVNPADPVVNAGLTQNFDPANLQGLWALNEEVTRQAAMVAYIDDFHLMIVIVAICAPMLLIMRPPRAKVEGPAHAYAE